MKIKRNGICRIVFLIGEYAIKVPNFTYCWHHFLQGLLSNINENKTWKYNGFDKNRKKVRDDLLCPVIWCSWGGWILVMKKAVPCTFVSEGGDYIDFSKWIVCGWGGDDKADNYGYIDNKIVKLDYGQLDG